MFKKILIANRGEIAIRIMDTARKMGIRTAAIYSDADTNALHVSQADEAHYVGPSPSKDSYINIKRVMEAIRRSGCDAVHPGYGFLSENDEFARAVEREGVKFIGPTPRAIKLMGDKIEAKKLAEKANVSTVPGYMGVIKDAKEAVKIAKKIGFPVILKAAAGGGGKGMRIVHDAKAMEQAFSSATNEAKNSFRDGRVFIEKFIQTPRHIEIQILADKHGNVLCLGERECSIQRNHQKVIEEAPSSFIDEKTRKKMYEQAISLAKKVSYVSAGTLEFIMDSKKNFYFMEMNTRLQVEHPVTELVTGIDLVEQMIRVAAGEKLALKQKDIKLKGSAIESRVYAEDPSRGFLPSSGRITQYQPPVNTPNVRVDSGVVAGSEVSQFYDPMVAKLITYGDTRDQAIEHMRSALGEFYISGITHNISFLEAVMQHERFAQGDISTNLIAEEWPEGFSGADLTEESTRVFIAIAAFIYLRDAYRAAQTSGQLQGRERQISTRWVITVGDSSFPVEVRETKFGYAIDYLNERIRISSSWVLGNSLFQGVVDDRPISARIEPRPGGYKITHSGSSQYVTVMSPRMAELNQFIPKRKFVSKSRKLESPITGKLVAVKVSEGEECKAGQELAIVEAMKMENIVIAEHDVTVKKIHVKPGDNVQLGQVLIDFA